MIGEDAGGRNLLHHSMKIKYVGLLRQTLQYCDTTYIVDLKSGLIVT
jgi:hypothetical protein